MTKSIAYCVAAFGSCYVPLAAARFTIDNATAYEIVKLAALVRENKLRKVEKFDYRANFLRFAPSSDDAAEVGEENLVRTEHDCLVVESDSFKFSAYIKDAYIEVSSESQPIADLIEHFNLAEKPTSPTVVVEMDGGAIHCVRSSDALEVILLDADTEGGDEAGVHSVCGEEVYVHHYLLNNPATDGQNGIDAAFVAAVQNDIAASN